MEIWAANSAFPSATHTAELRAVVRTIAEAGADCVVVTGAAGAGLSTFLEAAARALSGRFAVRVIGVPQSQSGVRFALGSILAPNLPGHTKATPLTMLRACQESLRLGGRPGPPALLVVDDADRLDESSLWVLNQLQSESRIRLLVSHHTDCQLKAELTASPSGQRVTPVVLKDLGLEGLMRLLQLPPTPNPPPPLVSDLYALGGGNLLRTQWLIEDAAERGAIEARDGLLSAALPAGPAAVKLPELARRRWARRTDAERTAVDLLAVGEPVALDRLEQLVSPATLAALEREGTIRVRRSPQAFVFLAHAADAMVARGMLERTRALELRGRLVESRGRTEESLWDLLNRVEYLQDAGGTVPDLDLLAVATVSNCLNDSPRAIRTAAAVMASQLQLPAQTELGRALFHAKDYERSAEVLLLLTETTPTVVSVDFARAVGLLLEVLIQRGAEPEVLHAVLGRARQRLSLAVAGSAGCGDAASSYQNAVLDELEVLGLYLESQQGHWPRPEGGLYRRLCTDQAPAPSRKAPRHADPAQGPRQTAPRGPAGVLLMALISQGLASDGNFAGAAGLSVRALQSAAELASCSIDLFSTILGIHSRIMMLGQGIGETTQPAAGIQGRTILLRDANETGCLDPGLFSRDNASGVLSSNAGGQCRGGNQFGSTSFAAANGYRALELLDLSRPARPAAHDHLGLAGQLPETDRGTAFLTQHPPSAPDPEAGGGSANRDTGRQRAPAPGRLSQREREVANLVVAGLGSAAVAAHLGIAVNTVNAHLQRVYGKLGISRRQDLAELWKALHPAES